MGGSPSDVSENPVTQEKLCSFSKLCHFTYVTAHSPTLLSLCLCHSSVSNPSVVSPASQLILQPFFCSSYVIGFSLTSPGEPSMIISGTTDLFGPWPSSEATLHQFLIPNARMSYRTVLPSHFGLPTFLVAFSHSLSIFFAVLWSLASNTCLAHSSLLILIILTISGSLNKL